MLQVSEAQSFALQQVLYYTVYALGMLTYADVC
jgi:hypothetical protein